MGTIAYNRDNTKRVCLKLNNQTDADIIEAFSREENVTAYIKRLIRSEIARKGKTSSDSET